MHYSHCAFSINSVGTWALGNWRWNLRALAGRGALETRGPWIWVDCVTALGILEVGTGRGPPTCLGATIEQLSQANCQYYYGSCSAGRADREGLGIEDTSHRQPTRVATHGRVHSPIHPLLLVWPSDLISSQRPSLPSQCVHHPDPHPPPSQRQHRVALPPSTHPSTHPLPSDCASVLGERKQLLLRKHPTSQGNDRLMSPNVDRSLRSIGSAGHL